jgi:hypothetical protein
MDTYNSKYGKSNAQDDTDPVDDPFPSGQTLECVVSEYRMCRGFVWKISSSSEDSPTPTFRLQRCFYVHVLTPSSLIILSFHPDIINHGSLQVYGRAMASQAK